MEQIIAWDWLNDDYSKILNNIEDWAVFRGVQEVRLHRATTSRGPPNFMHLDRPSMYTICTNECYDNEDQLQLFRPKARQQDKVYEEREESCWILHLRTGIFYLKGHEGVMNEVPNGAAIFASTFLAFSLYLPTLDGEVEGEFVDLLEPVKVPGCNLIKIQDLLNEVQNRKSDEYKWFLFHASRLSMARGIPINTWEELEPVSLKAIKSERTRFSLLHLEVVLAWGLELSQQSFIMVVRKPNDNADAAFYSAGSTTSDDPKVYLPDGLVERTNGLGLVVNSWAPQMAVLNHPSTGAFLSHCGWNSTLESVKHGVPVIGWPMYAEQRMNATSLSNEVGVAVKMPVLGDRGEAVLVGRKEIERVARIVMEGEEGKKIRSTAKELEASGSATLSRGGSSYETLAKVTELWKLD
ncbi:anthocyanidin 3-O-glucosyltransferase 5-like protein [Tanacetum coccineum]